LALPLYPQPASLAGVAMPPDQDVGGWIQETEQRVAQSAEQLRGSGAGGGMPAPIARRSLYPDRPVGYGLWQGGSFPVENFQTYTSAFGYRRSATGGRGSEMHRGLDIAAPRGSYIRNWWAGQVVRVSSGDSCGTAITVQSGQWQHIYCHMIGGVETRNGQRYLVDRDGGIQIAQGQVIPAGMRIGRVGMTGRTTGPHLHWGIRYAGNLVDPALVLRAMYAEQRRSPV
jgi:murein DD-endopeptidase MepM/ murein hydrolase activator NlpD